MNTNEFDSILLGLFLVLLFAVIWWGVLIVLAVKPSLLLWSPVFLFFVWECVKEYKKWKSK